MNVIELDWSRDQPAAHVHFLAFLPARRALLHKSLLKSYVPKTAQCSKAREEGLEALANTANILVYGALGLLDLWHVGVMQVMQAS